MTHGAAPVAQHPGRVRDAAKIWRRLLRDGEQVARCTVERLMRRLGIRGAAAGRPRGRPGPTRLCRSRPACCAGTSPRPRHTPDGSR
ncbi:IS3 family transposase [Dactylosporangium sp. NPDC051484]|uniref:IS3 family transposase n=1 Tax=Dactylosporangium sp. NPDC051484 TaxID=3154942 RepID=UPI00344F2AE1